MYAFWFAATQCADELLTLLDETPITMDQWFHWRSVLQSDGPTNIVEKGFATLFLNRTNRSGILKAGVIGGKEQAGDYKLDARFKKSVIVARIEAIASRAADISVYCEDSLHMLGRASTFLPKRSLIYLDPPYYVKGKGLYRNYYEHDDHAAIAKLLQKRGFKWPWVVSYDNAEEICAMYEFSQSLTYGLNYTAQRRYVGNEVMFFSNTLAIPDQAIPHTELVA